MLNIFSTKQTFLLLVFCNLIVQLIITRYAMIKAPKQKTKWYTLGLFLFLFLILFLLSFTLPMIVKFTLFCLFSIIFGFILGARSISETIIQIAFFGTLAIFVLMGVLGLLLSMLGIHLGVKFGVALFYALLLLILVSLFNLFTGEISHKLISGFSVLLFSGYIIYDTNVILQRNYKGDFITASIDYYLDIVNIFSSLTTFNDE